jgi:hypothetical protein
MKFSTNTDTPNDVQVFWNALEDGGEFFVCSNNGTYGRITVTREGVEILMQSFGVWKGTEPIRISADNTSSEIEISLFVRKAVALLSLDSKETHSWPTSIFFEPDLLQSHIETHNQHFRALKLQSSRADFSPSEPKQEFGDINESLATKLINNFKSCKQFKYRFNTISESVLIFD